MLTVVIQPGYQAHQHLDILLTVGMKEILDTTETLIFTSAAEIVPLVPDIQHNLITLPLTHKEVLSHPV